MALKAREHIFHIQSFAMALLPDTVQIFMVDRSDVRQAVKQSLRLDVRNQIQTDVQLDMPLAFDYHFPKLVFAYTARDMSHRVRMSKRQVEKSYNLQGRNIQVL